MELFRLNKNQEWLVYFRELGKKVNFYGVFWFFYFTLFTLEAKWATTQFPATRNSQITENLLKSSFSKAILDIYSQLFYGKCNRRSSFYSFLTVFWIFFGRIRRKNFLSVTRGCLRTLCTAGSAKRTTFEFFHSLEALEDSK